MYMVIIIPYLLKNPFSRRQFSKVSVLAERQSKSSRNQSAYKYFLFPSSKFFKSVFVSVDRFLSFFLRLGLQLLAGLHHDLARLLVGGGHRVLLRHGLKKEQ